MSNLNKEIQAYYNQDQEQTRLESSRGQLKQTRTEQLLARFLPPPPSVVVDVGGATGVYARARSISEKRVYGSSY